MKYRTDKPKSQINPAIASQLLAPLFFQAQGVIETRHKASQGRMVSRFYSTIGDLLNTIPRWNTQSHHYFGVATRRDSSSGKKANLMHLVCCHADVDYGPDRPHKTREDALGAIEGFPLGASAVVDTGNGFHCYWFLLVPLPAVGNLFQVEDINRGIGQALKGDNVGDASRVLRIPGTWNVKDPTHPKPVKLVWCERRRYSLEDFADYVAHNPREDKPRMAPRPLNYGDIGGTPYGRAALAGELASLAQVREGSHLRNIQLNKAAYALGRLVGGGQLDLGIVGVHLHQIGLNIGLPEKEVQNTLRSGLNAGIQNPRRP